MLGNKFSIVLYTANQRMQILFWVTTVNTFKMRDENNDFCIKETEIERVDEDKASSSIPWRTGRQRLLFVGIATMIFLANTCFSLQAPFFPLEVSFDNITRASTIITNDKLYHCLSCSIDGTCYTFLPGRIVQSITIEKTICTLFIWPLFYLSH